jgi:ABC-type branched-subunit amino acid transport system substrate-binding protein
MKPKILLPVLTALAAVVAVSVSIAGARSFDAATATRTYVPASTSKLKLPLVKIGTIATLNSASSGAPALPSVVIAAARGMNRAGGLHGHPIGVEFCDDKFDPNQSATCARQMINDGVIALIGGNSSFDGVSQPILEAAGIPMIGISPITPAAVNGKNVWLPTSGSSLSAYLALVGYAVHVAHDVPLAGYVNDNSVSKAFATTVEDQLKPINGGQGFVAMVPIGPSVADFTPIGAAVARTNPLGVFSFAGSTNGLGGMRATNQISNTVRHFYFPWSWNLNQLKTSAPDAMTKLIHAQGYPPLSDPRMARMLKDLKAEEARGDALADPTNIDQRTVDAWVGMQALLAVTKGLKSYTPQTVTGALQTAKDVKVGPFIPPWTPSAPGPSFYPRGSNQFYYFVTYKNNEQVLLLKHPVTVTNALAGKFS